MLDRTRVGGKTAPTNRPVRRRTRAGADGWWPWLFVVPTLFGVLTFYIVPIFRTGYLSFTEAGPFGGSTWIGGDNYRTLVSDKHVGLALINTVVYTGIVLLGVPLAILLASLIQRPGLRFANFYRVLFFMPYVAMPTAVALVWRLIYNGNFGILNWALGLVGIQGRYWTSTPGFAIVSVGVVGLWASFGFSMIILSAGLKNIPVDCYEAAQLDGASRWQQFTAITVPLLTPSIFFVTIISVIDAFKLFDLLYAIMGKDNPALQQSQSLVYIFYNQAFIRNNQGYGAAIGVLILAVIGAVTWFQFRMQKNWVNYV
jgi:multiple sugar transport system permease protein